MYEFRSLIAHGREILQKYRSPIRLEYGQGDSEYMPIKSWSRGTLMIESIVFCLIAALRKVISEGLMDRIKTPAPVEAVARRTAMRSDIHNV